MRNINHIIIMAVILTAPGLGAGILQEEDGLSLSLTQVDVAIDGDFSEWEGIPEISVNRTPDGKIMEGNQDISVSARFMYDAENFYAAVRVADDHMEFPDRSWRYGDGFYLTFVDSPEGEGVIFTSFGFSRQNGEDQKVLVNRNGVYFPGESIKHLEMKTRIQDDKNTMLYELAIPWDYLKPFQPFFRENLAVNLTYVDRDQGRRENIRQLEPDRHYDTEATNLRKGKLFQLNNPVPEKVQIQSLMNGTHFYHDDDMELKTALHSPGDLKGWRLRIISISGAFALDESKSLTLKAGMNRQPFLLPQRDYTSGVYDLSVGVVNSSGQLVYSRNHTFFILNRGELKDRRSRFNKMKAEIEEKQDAGTVIKSFPSVEIRFEWIEDFMAAAPDYAEFDPLKKWMEETPELMDELEKGRPALFPPGRVGRLAHKSGIDGTLQPYSVYVPPGFDPESPVPLLVTLHGSGVDEQTHIRSMVRRHDMLRSQDRLVPVIIMAPQARDLSGWYLGDSGRDVIECLRHLLTFYNIDKERIVLDGFSMGGYGAWRLGFLNPDLFRALIIRSGAIVPPPELEGENVLDFIQEPVPLNILIVHGDKDQAVPVEQPRRAVERLKKLGIKHEYIEVRGAGHGNYDKSQEIFRWLMRALNLQPDRRRIRR